MLNENDLHRYARQIIIQNFDEEGQEKILRTKCLIVGAGGLGWPVAIYAADAGFGHIEIYDEDLIEITNLNRQIAHQNNDIGLNKAENLAENGFYIPCGLGITNEEINLVAQTLKKILKCWVL